MEPVDQAVQRTSVDSGSYVCSYVACLLIVYRT